MSKDKESPHLDSGGDTPPEAEKKIQRSIKDMIKQMETSNEELQYRMENFDNVDVKKEYLKNFKCTKCNTNFQQVVNKGESVGIHPLLGVLMCDSCCDYYGDGDFSLDSEGEDKYCRWCGEGGTIFACSKCICGFCTACIEKHFGVDGLEKVRSDDDWVCYFCNNRPLWYLRSICFLANETAKNKLEQIQKNKEDKVKKKRRRIEKLEDKSSVEKSSSDSSSSSNKNQRKRKRLSRQRGNIKRDESSSSEDEKENHVNFRRKLPKSKRQNADRETSSESDVKNSKKKSKISCESSRNDDFENKKSLVLEKFKSIWKLTQTITEVGLGSSRERLKVLSKPDNFKTLDNLKKEHEELKSCMEILVSSLKTTSNSVDSIKEDLTFDNAKDEREIFQIQETKLKRYAKNYQEESSIQTSIDSNEDSTPKELEKEKKRKMLPASGKKKSVRDSGKVKRQNRESDVNSEKESKEGKKNLSLFGDSLSKEETEKQNSKSDDEKQCEKTETEDSSEKTDRVMPLLKVKSFARMLHENVYDKNKTTENKNENDLIVIDLYDIDTDDSENENQSLKDSSVIKSGSNSAKIPETEVQENSKNDKKEKNRSSGGDNEGESVCQNKKNENHTSVNEIKDKSPGKSNEKESSGVCDDDTKEKSNSSDEMKNKKCVSSSGGNKSDEDKDSDATENDDENENKQNTSDNESEKKKSENSTSTDDSSSSDSENASEHKEKVSSSEKNKKNEDVSNSDSNTSFNDEKKSTRSCRKKNNIKEALKSSFEKYKRKRKEFLSAKEKNVTNEKKTAMILQSSDSDNEEKKNEENVEKQRKKFIIISSEEESEKEMNEEEIKSNSAEKSYSKKTDQSSDETSSEDDTNCKKKTAIKKRKKKAWDSDSSEDEKSKKVEKKKKKKDSSESSEDEDKDKQKKIKKRRNIKKILKKDSLQVETKEALKNEEERKKRLKERQKLFKELFPEEKDEGKSKRIILDFDPETKEPLVSVHKKLAKKLKPHQVKGVRFMWDSCFESVQKLGEDSGSGCILAHCMGLGKTLQVITFIHTVMTHDLGVNTVLIICPLSTVSNWIHEFEMWLENIHTEPITLYDLGKYKRVDERRFQLENWHRDGGVLVLSYDLFRVLTKDVLAKKNKQKKGKHTQVFNKVLLDPGPDLVVCDEGHLLKNEDTALSKSTSRIKTSRRIILTGTPLQNNLKEYHCMVQFVKPNILGTRKEFCNRFVNPISNGQFEDSTELDVKIMKKRCHVLHSMLDGCIQSFDYSVLTPFLPEKHEYVLRISLTETQAKAYRHFLDSLSAKSLGNSRPTSLFNDYHILQRIWTHPRTILMHSERENLRVAPESESEGSLKDFVVSSDEETSTSKSESSDSSIMEVTPKKRILRSNANDPEVIKAIEEEEKLQEKHWWNEFYDEKAYDDLRESNKLVLLFSLLKYCGEAKDKVLVFSQSLYSLDLIEYFLRKVDENDRKNNESLCGHQDTWVLGADYFRMDGSTKSESRAIWCKYFNEESNTRARLFLISTKAGGLGINLYGANRVILFDASWNPSHDLQSIFRVYRFGQKKKCYIYRFLAEATMEEKIYERQVTKLSLAHRVVDEHQIERHYTMGNLQELYTFQPTPKDQREVPTFPKDPVLADLLEEHENIIVGYHEHDSLLVNKQEEELTEEERKAAWKEYEEEKALKSQSFDFAMKQSMMLMQQHQQLQQQFSQGAPGTGASNPTSWKPLHWTQFLNPKYLQSNIPLDVIERGLRVGLTPLPDENLESFIMKLLTREAWMLPKQ